MRRNTVISQVLDNNGPDIEFEYEPVEDSILQAKVGNKYIVAYLVHDNDLEYDNLMGDCMGQMFTSQRYSGQHSEMQDALGLDSNWEPQLDAIYDDHYDEVVKRYIDKLIDTRGVEFLKATCLQNYAQEDGENDEGFVRHSLQLDCDGARSYQYVLFDDDMEDVLKGMFNEPEYFPGDKDVVQLDCYSHGADWWSISGQGMQCQWDTAQCAGVWVPDKCLREQLDNDEAEGEDRHAKVREYCKQFLDQHNAICNGDVYGCVCHIYDEDGERNVDEIADEWWGVVGYKYAKETLKADLFEPKCKHVQEN